MFAFGTKKTKNLDNVADLCKFLSDQTRLKILDFLLRKKEGANVGVIAEAVDASASATSHQLAKLEARNLVSATRCGQAMCYTLKDTKELQKITSIMDTCTKS